MTKLRIKPKTLERLIQEMVDEAENFPKFYVRDAFAIHIGKKFEVQVVVTRDKTEFCGKVYRDYDEADE